MNLKGKLVAIDFKDDRCGIAKEILGKVFDGFFLRDVVRAAPASI